MKSAEKVSLAVTKAEGIFLALAQRARDRRVRVERILKNRRQHHRFRVCAPCVACRALNAERAALNQTIEYALASQSCLLEAVTTENVRDAQRRLRFIFSLLRGVQYQSRPSGRQRSAMSNLYGGNFTVKKMDDLQRHLDYVYGQLMK